MTTQPTRITLLVQENCSLCEHAKGVLARVGRDVPLVIDEVDLSSDLGRQLAQRAGVMFAPGFFIDGQMFGFGRLSEKKLRRALQQRPATVAPGAHP